TPSFRSRTARRSARTIARAPSSAVVALARRSAAALKEFAKINPSSCIQRIATSSVPVARARAFTRAGRPRKTHAIASSAGDMRARRGVRTRVDMNCLIRDESNAMNDAIEVIVVETAEGDEPANEARRTVREILRAARVTARGTGGTRHAGSGTRW
ncbi:hypothetical protein BE221DRAFT_172753, partial [Ostreococcus tauri]